MTDERVKKIKERRAKITPGKWHNEGCVVVDENSIVVGEESYGWRFVAHVNSDTEESANRTPPISEAEAGANAEFIENAPDDIDHLQRGLVVMSALINFIDWLDREQYLDSRQERGEIVKEFLDAHQDGQNYFMQAEQIADALGIPFMLRAEENNETNKS